MVGRLIRGNIRNGSFFHHPRSAETEKNVPLASSLKVSVSKSCVSSQSSLVRILNKGRFGLIL